MRVIADREPGATKPEAEPLVFPQRPAASLRGQKMTLSSPKVASRVGLGGGTWRGDRGAGAEQFRRPKRLDYVGGLSRVNDVVGRNYPEGPGGQWIKGRIGAILGKIWPGS